MSCCDLCRKKAISRAGGISALVAVVGGRSAEASMHAAQSLLHMAKLPDLKVSNSAALVVFPGKTTVFYTMLKFAETNDSYVGRCLDVSKHALQVAIHVCEVHPHD